MLGSLFSNIGSNIGKAFGGGIFSTVGRFAGRWIGSILDDDIVVKEYYHLGKIIDNVFVDSDIYGTPIAEIYGNHKVKGRIIWAKNIRQEATETKNEKYYSKTTVIHHKTEFSYYGNFALALCKGEVDQILRVWFNDKLIDLSMYDYRFYRGDERQMPDRLIYEEYGNYSPAFRGLSYVIFENLPLKEFGNKIPEFSFEISKKPKLNDPELVENMVKSIVIIPGSGEFVYDTKIVNKKIFYDGNFVDELAINSHNKERISDAVYSFHQLKNTCKNIEWIAPVVSWFCDSLDIENCNIYPAVEYHDRLSETTEEWMVAGKNRYISKVISKDQHGRPNYGGTVSDESIIRYLKFLKSQNIKIMLYPMIFLDLDNKPWRGHISGHPGHVEKFFNHPEGYNNFIIHYANLCKDLVDVFIIGSELKNITSIKNGNNFPAVDELIKLARKVKNIVGESVKVTYAADWSEYHHTDGGWYNLDPLWSDDSIDFVGIDNYFPLTSSRGNISDEEIIKGFNSGEGYDYYFDEKGQQHKLLPAYAWKNLKWWWENKHQNPNGEYSKWIPKSKKIWFTEFGFPSIDKATNQPNIFYDPRSKDGGVPKYSSGNLDFDIQRRAIKLFYEFWSKEEYIERSFLWTWDARPYPAWPYMKYWSDSHLWAKGHWINSKFGFTNINSIIDDICKKSNINNINIIALDENINGIILNKNYTAIQILSMLRCIYFFDISENESGNLIFKKRKKSKIVILNSDNFIKFNEDSFIEIQTISDIEKINKVAITYSDILADYNNNYKICSNEFINSLKAFNYIKLPVVLSENEAEKIANLILDNISEESKIYKFKLSQEYILLSPGDLIKFNYDEKLIFARIINILFDGDFLYVTSVSEQDIDYQFSSKANIYSSVIDSFGSPNLSDYSRSIINDLELDIKKFDIIQEKEIFCSLNQICILNDTETSISNPDYILYFLGYGIENLDIFISDDRKNFSKIGTTNSKNFKARLIDFYQDKYATEFLIDRTSFFIVEFEEVPDVKNGMLFNKSYNLMIGNEILSYNSYERISEKIYKFSILIRGLFGSKSEIFSHKKREFVSTIISPTKIYLSRSLINKEIFYKTTGSLVKSIKIFPDFNNINSISINDLSVLNSILFIRLSIESRIFDNWIDTHNHEIKNFKIIIRQIDDSNNYVNFRSTSKIGNIKEFYESDFDDTHIIIYTKYTDIEINFKNLELRDLFEISISAISQNNFESKKIIRRIKI